MRSTAIIQLFCLATASAYLPNEFNGFVLPTLPTFDLLDITPCNSLTQCSGKGFCLGSAKKAACICFVGFQGETCQQGTFNDVGNEIDNNQLPTTFLQNPLALDANACTAADCSNSGVCVGAKSAPICLCNLGKLGQRCETDVTSLLNLEPGAPLTFCSPSDCNNKGICMGTKNSFVCACQIGYTGSQCENTPYTLCDSRDCSSNGLCIGSRDSFTCACYLGYSGDRCQTITGTICENSDCNSNGICVGTKKLMSCICAPGYYGSRCEQRFGILPGTEGLFCETKDCSGNGICLGNKLLPTCFCAPGFLGLRCELEPMCTGALQCSNNGLCVGSLKSFTCYCNLGWTGVNCAQSTLLDGSPSTVRTETTSTTTEAATEGAMQPTDD